jgi:hypothetical protein
MKPFCIARFAKLKQKTSSIVEAKYAKTQSFFATLAALREKMPANM